ncbi:MAG: response regulator [Epsilonproteobacteria bacterium]|nr:response regulator [Campylobacterota bacterium]
MQEFKDIKLLYVDDDKDGREIIDMFLHEYFDSVDMASNGFEALEMFKSKDYDLVISDINMPKMNGIELFKEIRKLNKKIPLILISAYEKDIIDNAHLNISAYISKPIDIDEFLEAVKKVKKN